MARRPVEHVGSTSVPGLAAKPIVDIPAASGPATRRACACLRILDILEQAEDWAVATGWAL